MTSSLTVRFRFWTQIVSFFTLLESKREKELAMTYRIHGKIGSFRYGVNERQGDPHKIARDIFDNWFINCSIRQGSTGSPHTSVYRAMNPKGRVIGKLVFCSV